MKVKERRVEDGVTKNGIFDFCDDLNNWEKAKVNCEEKVRRG